eukprot:TRINITY_DN21086_c0_g1_i1.p1 TRINITY_DN21086_c0_g1~~TRINITY_DN21086_c0_g1_i1.p1  ORF type:complete len:295 (-),score=42.13 TRINITY_DN21086_c0_g1_i1:989-1873(-)
MTAGLRARSLFVATLTYLCLDALNDPLHGLAFATTVVTTSHQLIRAIQGKTTEIVIGGNFAIAADVPAITRTLLIRGNSSACSSKGQRCVLRGRYKRRHFLVTKGGGLTLRNVELQSGQAVKGGSVYVTDGAYLHAHNVRFSFNFASGVLFGGGAIEVDGGSFLKVTNADFSRNAGGFGGAVDVAGSSTATIAATLFHRNTAGVAGGAVSVLVGSHATISGGVVSGNSAPLGGIAYADAAPLTVCNVSAFLNTASSLGPGFLASGTGKVKYCGEASSLVSTVRGGTAVHSCSSC